jgi:hypothetical protein
MDKMFKQRMNQEQKMYGQDIGCGWFGECECVFRVCMCVCRRWGSKVSVWLGQFEGLRLMRGKVNDNDDGGSKVSVWLGQFETCA